MSRSKRKYPIIRRKSYTGKLTYSKVLRKSVKQYIKSHINDNIDIAYMTSIPNEKEYSTQIRFYRYKTNFLISYCKMRRRKWSRYHTCCYCHLVPLFLKDEVCKECEKYFLRK